MAEAMAPAAVQSPPPAEQPPQPQPDPRQRLHALAQELGRRHSRRLLRDYLRLRRAVR